MAMAVDKVIAEADAILARAEAAAIATLTPVMAMPPRPNQLYACLELFHTQNYELVYNSFSKKNGKLFTEFACLNGFAGEKSFIPELADYFHGISAQLDWSDADGAAFGTRHEAQMISWFKKVWTAAGGEKAKVPVYFCFEKEYRVSNVQTGQVMEELEAAQAIDPSIKEVDFG